MWLSRQQGKLARTLSLPISDTRLAASMSATVNDLAEVGRGIRPNGKASFLARRLPFNRRVNLQNQVALCRLPTRPDSINHQ